jgi:hypothetical protein
MLQVCGNLGSPFGNVMSMVLQLEMALKVYPPWAIIEWFIQEIGSGIQLVRVECSARWRAKL